MSELSQSELAEREKKRRQFENFMDDIADLRKYLAALVVHPQQEVPHAFLARAGLRQQHVHGPKRRVLSAPVVGTVGIVALHQPAILFHVQVGTGVYRHSRAHVPDVVHHLEQQLFGIVLGAIQLFGSQQAHHHMARCALRLHVEVVQRVPFYVYGIS